MGLAVNGVWATTLISLAGCANLLAPRDSLELDKDEWTPIYTPLEERPDRVVEERVTTDDRVSTWVKGMRSQEERIVEAERTLRLSEWAVWLYGCVALWLCVCCTCWHTCRCASLTLRWWRAGKDFTSLMTLLGGHARLRHYEAHGRVR